LEKSPNQSQRYLKGKSLEEKEMNDKILPANNGIKGITNGQNEITNSQKANTTSQNQKEPVRSITMQSFL
jgi:hypothetical protein